MTNEQLVRLLQKYPANAKVILANDFGANELDSDYISFEEMDYVEYESPLGHSTYNWEHRDVYPRKIILTEKVIIIR